MKTREEAVKAVTLFEIEHSVEGYRCYNWNVWPVLRVFTCFEMIQPTQLPRDLNISVLNKPSDKACLKNMIKSFKPIQNTIRYICKQVSIRNALINWKQILTIDPAMQEMPTATGRDIIIFTLSGRRVKLGHCLYEMFSDPLVECLNKYGVSSIVWERMEELWPRCSPSAWTSKLLELELLKLPQLQTMAEPVWFMEFAEFASAAIGRDVTWPEIAGLIQSVEKKSRVFEQWIRKTGAKAIISVCWYEYEVMAATLAAKRLGVASVDLQHGIQDDSHFAYSGWTKKNHGGYELVPHFFWSWGKDSAERVLDNNPAFEMQKTIIGGNLWFNKWRDEQFCIPENMSDNIFALTGQSEKIILVTFQHSGCFYDFIIEAIQKSPQNWYWLLRFHPNTPISQRSHIEGLLRKIDHKNFDYEQASIIPLFALLKYSNVHVTGHSTCALEALAYGVHSITVTGVGVDSFKSYVDRGVIQYFEDVDKFVQHISQLDFYDKEKYIEHVKDLFASSNFVDKNICDFLSGCNITTGDKSDKNVNKNT